MDQNKKLQNLYYEILIQFLKTLEKFILSFPSHELNIDENHHSAKF